MLIESADHLGCSLKNWRDIKVCMSLPFSSIFHLTTMKKLNFMPTILPEPFKKDDPLITYVWFTSIKQQQMSNTCWIYLDQKAKCFTTNLLPQILSLERFPVANSLPLNVVGTQDIWTRFWPRFYAQIHPHHLRCALCVSLWSSRMWRCHSVDTDDGKPFG